METNQPTTDALALLERLIATPSFSREESATAGLIADWLAERGHVVERQGNNVWSTRRANLPPATDPAPKAPAPAEGAPSAGARATPKANAAECQRHQRSSPPPAHLLLNSHHDTVKPAATWTTDPFAPTWDGDRLTGLGSNDAGGPLVAMLAAFDSLKAVDLPFDLTVAATAEEEVSGAGGIASILDALGPITCGIVGEPTSLDAAVAEKGLVVIDGLAVGVSGHAARGEGTNALYRALDDIDVLRKHVLAKASPSLGPVLVTVTQIEAGTQHNVVPDACRFVVDVRTTDAYTNEATVRELQALVTSTLTPRSLRLQPSGLSPKHPLYRAAVDVLGLRPYGSPTLSDQALMPFPTLKLGPGDSARSHTAQEYILRSEVAAGVECYRQLILALDLSAAPPA